MMNFSFPLWQFLLKKKLLEPLLFTGQTLINQGLLIYHRIRGLAKLGGTHKAHPALALHRTTLCAWEHCPNTSGGEKYIMMVVCYHSSQEFLFYLTLSVYFICIPEVVMPITFHLQAFSTWLFHLSGDWVLIWVPISHLQWQGKILVSLTWKWNSLYKCPSYFFIIYFFIHYINVHRFLKTQTNKKKKTTPPKPRTFKKIPEWMNGWYYFNKR